MPQTFNSRGITVSTPNGDMVLIAGQNIRILPSGNTANISAQTPAGSIINGNGLPWQPPSLADAKALNNSVYFSTDANKLVYKAADASIHDLY
jgi:hypothetical protein